MTDVKPSLACKSCNGLGGRARILCVDGESFRVFDICTTCGGSGVAPEDKGESLFEAAHLP